MAGVQTVKRGGSRHYVDPAEPLVNVPGVTSIIDMLNKPFLPYWYAKMTAELAVSSIGFLQDLADRDEQGAVNYLKGAATNYTKTRAGIGSKAHDLFERMIRGESVRRVEPDLEPYRRGFDQFLNAVAPELVSAEDVMWSDTHKYAGSSDVIMKVWLDERNRINRLGGEPVLCIGDWKTGKDLHNEVALQLSAYAHADRLIDADGVSHPMPEIEMGAALHITPEGWQFVPINIGDDVFRAFLALREAFDWDRETQKTVLGKPLATWESGFTTGTERRAK
jgi:hypothetical protein